MNESFKKDEVVTSIKNIETAFADFATMLNDINEVVQLLVEHDTNSALKGPVGKNLIEMWNQNSSTFQDFHMNFEQWATTVNIIAANNDQFVVDTTALYRSNAGNLESTLNIISSDKTYDGTSTYEFKPGNAFPDGIPEYATCTDNFNMYAVGGKRYSWTDENGVWTTVFTDAENNIIAKSVSVGTLYSDDKYVYGESTYYDATGKEITFDELIALQLKNQRNEATPGSGDAGEGGNLDEEPDGEKNNDDIIGESANYKAGDTITISSNGIEETYKAEGLVQRGDMTQEQIFSDSHGNLYYYEDGIMKELHVYDYSSSDVSEHATIADLGKERFSFQNTNGDYSTSAANVTAKVGGDVYNPATIDTDGFSESSYGYSVASSSYEGFDPKSDYEGKGTTLYVPESSPYETSGSYYDVNAKELMTTSVIDVRNNLAQEATQMQTYLDSNRMNLTEPQIAEIETQISNREIIAGQMGKDVTFGDGVTDGIIGNYGTFWYTESSADNYQFAVDRINSYPEGFINEEGVSIPGLNSLKSVDDIVNGR